MFYSCLSWLQLEHRTGLHKAHTIHCHASVGVRSSSWGCLVLQSDHSGFHRQSHLLCELFSDRRSWSSFLFIPINRVYIFGSIHWALTLMDVNAFICIIPTRTPPPLLKELVNFLFFWFEKNKTLLLRSSNGLFTLAFHSSGRSPHWVRAHSLHFSQACLTELTL